MIFFSLVLNNFAFGEIPQSSEIIAYYPFSGNANDSSGFGYNGTLGDGSDSSKNPTLTTGYDGTTDGAYSFDGISNYISNNKIVNKTKTRSFTRYKFTYSLWIYAEDGIDKQITPMKRLETKQEKWLS